MKNSCPLTEGLQLDLSVEAKLLYILLTINKMSIEHIEKNKFMTKEDIKKGHKELIERNLT